MKVKGLRCEYFAAPVGITEAKPRLSWRLDDAVRAIRQSAYHVLVASSPVLLEQDEGDLWDSGKVVSAESVHVAYAGEELSSRDRCWWKVRVWDRDDRVSPWSETGYWELGLLTEADWQAQWIAVPHEELVPGGSEDDSLFPCPLLRRSFSLPGEAVSARLYVTARGLYEARINGNRVGDARLTPGWTDFAKRTRVQTYDVTGLLEPGDNCLAAYPRHRVVRRPHRLVHADLRQGSGTAGSARGQAGCG